MLTAGSKRRAETRWMVPNLESSKHLAEQKAKVNCLSDPELPIKVPTGDVISTKHVDGWLEEEGCCVGEMDGAVEDDGFKLG